MFFFFTCRFAYVPVSQGGISSFFPNAARFRRRYLPGWSDLASRPIGESKARQGEVWDYAYEVAMC